MHRFSPLAAQKPAPRNLRLLALALFACAGINPLLQSQASTPVSAADKGASAIHPADSYPAAAPFNSNAFSTYLGLEPGSGASAFGQSPYAPPIPYRGANLNSLQWSPFTPNSLQSAPSFGFIPGAAVGIRSRRTRNAGSPGAGEQTGGSFRRSGAVGVGEGFGDPALLFPASGDPTPSLSSGVAGPFQPAPGTAPSLNQLMRGGFNLPHNTSFSVFQLPVQDRFAQGSNGTGLDFSRMIASGMFTSPDLGNGVRFSAGAGKSIAGSSAGGLKHSGPTVALKLSF